MLTSTLVRGGSERQMLATAYGLKQRGYEVEILELSRVAVEQHSFRDELLRLGLTSRWVGETTVDFEGQGTDGGEGNALRRFAPLIPHLDIMNLAAAVRRVIEDFRPEIVHCWSNITNVIGGVVAAEFGIPKIVLAQRNVTPDKQNFPRSELYRDAYCEILRNPNVTLINNSMANIADHERWLALPSGTIKLLYNGFLPGSIQIRRNHEIRDARRSLGLPDGARIVGAVMRLALEKDPDLWLNTALAIAQARTDTYFVLAGWGDMSDEVAAKIQELGLADRFNLTGPTADVGLIYAALDVFLMSSRFEGTPNTLTEAQAAGVPIVAPLVGGTGEAVVHGTTAMLVEERTAASLARGVLHVLDAPIWRQRSASDGPKFVSDRFNHRTMIDRTASHYGHSRI
jgi:glycosyltransferase involved in cell wall biosynthesis